MTGAAGRPAAALVLAALAAAPAAAGAGAEPVLEVVSGRQVLLAEPLGPDGRWCLVWNHSVTGGEVADCFRAEAGLLVLESSAAPDFAAGLGEVPGRGRTVPDGAGGYMIEGIDEPLPSGLALRPGGPAVRHRLRIGDRERPLPASLARQPVLLRLAEARE